MDKSQARQFIIDKVAEFKTQYKEGKGLPTDRQINEFSNAFYKRDRYLNVTYDVEMMAVVRGIDQGMKILRNIIEEE